MQHNKKTLRLSLTDPLGWARVLEDLARRAAVVDLSRERIPDSLRVWVKFFSFPLTRGTRAPIFGGTLTHHLGRQTTLAHPEL